jgi:hypothetical protein
LLCRRERYRRFNIRTGQPENNMGDVVLRVRRKTAHGFECLIEKFCHREALPVSQRSPLPTGVTNTQFRQRGVHHVGEHVSTIPLPFPWIPYIKGLARNLAAKGVRANMVSSGNVYFKGGVWNTVEERTPDLFKEMLSLNPMGRMGRPDEVANAVVFLASPRASFITGTNLIIDGALTQRVQF